ncbi:MAG: DUF356 domain-containing protein [Candidatus Methanoperedens sp.]|nr:DUF356 domain-containing protein [Candidatus Methanoperedens sp.]
MKSLAIVRAPDILKLKSMLLEMNHAGLSFEGKPKEINPASIEKILSLDPPSENYEVCALVSLAEDYESSHSIIKALPSISDAIILDDSHKFFKNFAKMMTVLPDLIIPRSYTDINKQTVPLEKSSRVYLGVFVNRKVQVQTVSDSVHTGILKHADSIGVFFEPSDDSDPLFITWHDIKKIIIPKEEKKTKQVLG